MHCQYTVIINFLEICQSLVCAFTHLYVNCHIAMLKALHYVCACIEAEVHNCLIYF